MEKIKKKKSEKFLKNCLQVLALQFPDVKIKYGYDTTLINMHVIELICEGEPDSNKPLLNAYSAIENAFEARFFGKEEILFTYPNDGTSFKVDEPILTYNIEITEEERLYNELHGPYLPADHPINCKVSKVQAIA